MLQIALWLLVAYIAYRFVFGFVLPVSKATRDVRRQFRAAQEEMESRMRAQQGYGQGETVVKEGASAGAGGTNSGSPVSGAGKEVKKEYIDFEEIKE